MISVLALVRKVMDFLKCPGNLPAPLYVTFTVPVFPGNIGSCEYSGIVHPQEATA